MVVNEPAEAIKNSGELGRDVFFLGHHPLSTHMKGEDQTCNMYGNFD